MDSSKVFGESEECHSSESGWTMYIGDDHDDGDYAATDDGDDDDVSGDGVMDANHEEESDDSMASDASSGPSHHYGTGEAHEFKPTKEAEGTGSDRKAKRRMEKQKAEMKMEAKDQEVMSMAKRVSAPAQSQCDSKVRKNVWNMAKRK